MSCRLFVSVLVTALLLPVAAVEAFNRQPFHYKVTITNLTPGQSFTPVLAVTHTSPVALFELGDAASIELSILAEGGDTEPLSEVLRGFPHLVSDIQTSPGLLPPGETKQFSISSSRPKMAFSLAAMLVPTNDTFVALNAVELPRHGTSTFYALAYDAGSEPNDQSCVNIPGPVCMGSGVSVNPDPTDEGFVHVSNGFHDLGPGTLPPAKYDWNNPVAKITIKRVR